MIELLIGLVAVAFGGVLYFRNEAIKATSQVKQAETKIKDAALVEQQKTIEQAIADLDKGIEELQKKRDQDVKSANTFKTLEERAKEANERYKK